MKTIVFGDVHGCYEQLFELMERISPGPDDRIISLGDFVDRGPDSPSCVEFIKKYEAIMGNHEYKHVRFRNGILKRLNRSQLQTVEQYHVIDGDYGAAVDYMETLPFYLELPEAILVHAGLEYGVPMAEQNRIVLVGGMSQRHITGIDPETGWPYWCARYPKDAKPVLFGHMNIPGGLCARENLFPLDTGCVAGGMLSALSLPDFTLYQVLGWHGEY